MKKIKLLSLVAFLALPGFAFASIPSSVGGVCTGNLLLQGLVVSTNLLTVNPVGVAAMNLDIISGNSALLVATVTETSNALSGYKIFIKSNNGGALKNVLDANKKTTYTLAYDGGAPLTLNTSFQQAKNVANLSGLTNYNSNVNVTVAAYPTAPMGTYQDTVTFQIVANP